MPLRPWESRGPSPSPGPHPAGADAPNGREARWARGAGQVDAAREAVLAAQLPATGPRGSP